MRKPLGYATVVEPDKSLVERDTVTCAHCQRIVFVKPGTGSTVYLIPQPTGSPREEMGAFCRRCMAPVCLECNEDGRCLPFERQLEQAER